MKRARLPNLHRTWIRNGGKTKGCQTCIGPGSESGARPSRLGRFAPRLRPHHGWRRQVLGLQFQRTVGHRHNHGYVHACGRNGAHQRRHRRHCRWRALARSSRLCCGGVYLPDPRLSDRHEAETCHLRSEKPSPITRLRLNPPNANELESTARNRAFLPGATTKS